LSNHQLKELSRDYLELQGDAFNILRNMIPLSEAEALHDPRVDFSCNYHCHDEDDDCPTQRQRSEFSRVVDDESGSSNDKVSDGYSSDDSSGIEEDLDEDHFENYGQPYS
jgi:hypothetical protein